jgi:hypothetical protein
MNKEIKEAAVAVFEAYPNAKQVFITPDGQAFLAEDRAKLHNKEVTTVKRSEVMEAKLPAAEKKTADQLIADMPSVATIAELDVLAKGEKRKTVLDAIEARRKELTQTPE